MHFTPLFLILISAVNHTTRGSISTSTLPRTKLRKCSRTIITRILSFILFFFYRYADHRDLHSFPTRRSSDLNQSCAIANVNIAGVDPSAIGSYLFNKHRVFTTPIVHEEFKGIRITPNVYTTLNELDRFCNRSEEHTSELQSQFHLVCRLLLEK